MAEKGKVLQAVVDVSGTVDPSLGKMVDQAVGFLNKIDLKAVAVTGAIGGLTIGTIKMVKEAGNYLLDLGTSFDDATDSIRIGTGATGEALDELMEDFDALYKSVPTNMEDASQAIADYNTRLGLTGNQLQILSKQALQVSDLLDEDLTTVIKNSSEAFEAWDIEAENMADSMDYIFKVSQSTGLGFNDITDKIQKFAPQLKEMGYSFEEAAALVGQLEKAGVNTDEVLGALKKSVGALAKDGIGAAEGIQMYYEQIENAGSAAEAAAIAQGVFGAKAGPTMAAAIRDGKLSIEDLTAELTENSETIAGAADDTYDFAEKMQMARQNLEVMLKPLANTVFDGLNEFMPMFLELLEEILPIVGDLSRELAPLIQEVFVEMAANLKEVAPMFAELAQNLLPVISKFVSKLIPPMMSFVKKILPPLMDIINVILPPLLDLLMAVLPIIAELADAFLPLIVQVLAQLMPIISPLLEILLHIIDDALMPLIVVFNEIVGVIMNLLMPVIQALSAVFVDTLGEIFEDISPIFDNIQGVFQGIIDFIKNIFEGNWSAAWESVVSIFGNIWAGLENFAKIPINAVITLVNQAIGALNSLSVTMPEWSPVGAGKTYGFDIPEIPKLATGGFTDGLSFAGEDPRFPTEAVISFNPAYKKQNLGYWAEAGRMLGASDYDSISALASGDNVTSYDMGGVTYAPQITIQGNASKADVIAALKENEAEFMDLLREIFVREREMSYSAGN